MFFTNFSSNYYLLIILIFEFNFYYLLIDVKQGLQNYVGLITHTLKLILLFLILAAVYWIVQTFFKLSMAIDMSMYKE